MYNPAADPRRPNTGGFRLAPFRDAAGVTVGDRRYQAAAAARQVAMPKARPPSASGQVLQSRQTSPAPRPARVGPAGAAAASKSRPISADGREVGRLSGLVHQGEHAVQRLLESLRALKEKNRMLVETDAARRIELAVVSQRDSDARALIDELHDRLGRLARDTERLAAERAQGVANAARLVELTAAERAAAQQREAELMRMLSAATGSGVTEAATGAGGIGGARGAGVGVAGQGRAGGASAGDKDAAELGPGMDEMREQMRIELRLEARARESQIRSELAVARRDLELERRRHARSRADALAAAAGPAASLCNECAARARAGPEGGAGGAGDAPTKVEAVAGHEAAAPETEGKYDKEEREDKEVAAAPEAAAPARVAAEEFAAA